MSNVLFQIREYALKIVRKEMGYTLEKGKQILGDKYYPYLVQMVDLEYKGMQLKQLRKNATLSLTTKLAIEGHKVQTIADEKYINSIDAFYQEWLRYESSDDIKADIQKVLDSIKLKYQPLLYQLRKQTYSLFKSESDIQNAINTYNENVDKLINTLQADIDAVVFTNYR